MKCLSSLVILFALRFTQPDNDNHTAFFLTICLVHLSPPYVFVFKLACLFTFNVVINMVQFKVSHLVIYSVFIPFVIFYSVLSCLLFDELVIFRIPLYLLC